MSACESGAQQLENGLIQAKLSYLVLLHFVIKTGFLILPHYVTPLVTEASVAFTHRWGCGKARAGGGGWGSGIVFVRCMGGRECVTMCQSKA